MWKRENSTTRFTRISIVSLSLSVSLCSSRDCRWLSVCTLWQFTWHLEGHNLQHDLTIPRCKEETKNQGLQHERNFSDEDGEKDVTGGTLCPFGFPSSTSPSLLHWFLGLRETRFEEGLVRLDSTPSHPSSPWSSTVLDLVLLSRDIARTYRSHIF